MIDAAGLPGQVRVLAGVLEVAPVERVARDVDARREHHVDALGERLGARAPAVALREHRSHAAVCAMLSGNARDLPCWSPMPAPASLRTSAGMHSARVRRDDARRAVVGLIAVGLARDLLDLVRERHVRHHLVGRAGRRTGARSATGRLWLRRPARRQRSRSGAAARRRRRQRWRRSGSVRARHDQRHDPGAVMRVHAAARASMCGDATVHARRAG